MASKPNRGCGDAYIGTQPLYNHRCDEFSIYASMALDEKAQPIHNDAESTLQFTEDAGNAEVTRGLRAASQRLVQD